MQQPPRQSTARLKPNRESHQQPEPNILVIQADKLVETNKLATAMLEKIADFKVPFETLVSAGRSTLGEQPMNETSTNPPRH